MNTVIGVDGLAAQLGRPGLHLFDATKFLPGEGKDGRTRFLQAHIPGARFFDIDEVADPETDLPHMVPSAGRFGRLLGAMGVADGDRVVFYDQKGLFSAARAWWLMGLFGHDDAWVLDGGLPAWIAAGQATEAGEPAAPTPARFTATLRAARLRGVGDMLATIRDGDALVLDARPAGRFSGAAPEPRPGLPSGHMPGARNLPHTELLRPDGTLRPADELRARFAGLGADGSRPIVTTCGTGVTATVLTLALAQAGLPPGAVYDGSWTEWAGRPDTPKVTDAPEKETT